MLFMVYDFMVLQYPHTTIWKHSDQILNTGIYWVLRIELVQSTVKYPRQLLTTIWEHIRYHWIPLATLNTQIILILFKRFLRWTRSSNKRWRPQTICLRASIVFIWTNPAKIQIYWQLLLPTQIPPNTWVFEGIWVANIKYRISVKYRQILYIYMGTSLKAIC